MDNNKSLITIQAFIKRRQIQPMYNKYLKNARYNYTIEQLNEMAKPYTIKNLRTAWSNYNKENTIYGKPSNRLKKAELYHELLYVNYNFEKLPKKNINNRR